VPMTCMNREYLLNLVDECEAGTAQLTYDGEHAAEVLADHGWPDGDRQERAVRNAAAAAAPASTRRACKAILNNRLAGWLAVRTYLAGPSSPP
jgi:hypothetical protein